MKYKELKEVLRSQFRNYIVPLVKKNECEICKNKDNLEVHHVVPFVKQLEEVLKRLNIKNDSTIDNNLELIVDLMLASQIKNKNITLCEKCHGKQHINELFRINNNFDLYYSILKENKKENRIIYGNEIILPYLERIEGQIMLAKKDRKELIETINVKSNGKILKNIDSLNSALKELKIPYVILELPKISKTIDGKTKQYKTPWKVVKL